MNACAAARPRCRAPLVRARTLAATTVCAVLLLVSGALAGTYGPVSCSLNDGSACKSSERHTYDDNGANAPSAGWAYIASWLVNPSTGTNINVVWGYGTAYAYYRANTDLFLDGWWGNYSGVSPVTVRGTFNY
jgi:hypothetical protein